MYIEKIKKETLWKKTNMHKNIIIYTLKNNI